ncbi:flagellar hook assembly protein FlgD [Succinivibrio dextrinosolvens]|uniref:flagellar hook assembly protein FlgD n=1 Tax=Succinivibrio dextrinosolvens TaxID=83771 RepID=UPI0019229A23|nr:flagellar hook capping FlgD N-terminal domain-containing protein [Succinivibrio dextrinosolvens]
MSVDFSSIGKTSSYINQQEAAASAKKNNNALDQADFLKLLTTQLTNQDPSSPVDNNQMVSTMSQLSIVDNLTTITNGMDNIVNSISSSSALSASSLVGRSVLVDSSTAFFDGNSPLMAQIDAGSGASDVKVTITDNAGSIISSFSASNIDGVTDFSWDGVKDAETGEMYPAGKYTVVVSAMQGGKEVNLPVKTYGTVGSVVLGNTVSDTKLNILGYGEVSLDNVGSISL